MDDLQEDEEAWSRLAYHENQERYFRARGEQESADSHAEKRDHWRQVCHEDLERVRILGLIARQLAAQDCE